MAFMAGILTLYLVGVFYTQRHDRLDLIKLTIRDLRRHRNEPNPFLLMIDTAPILQYVSPDHIYVQFDFPREFATDSTEQVCAINEIKRYYSCTH